MVLAVIAGLAVGQVGPAACDGLSAGAFAGSGTVIVVPGLPHLARHDSVVLSSVSCPSPGNCAAAGYFTERGGVRAFVVSQAGGSWRPATLVRGIPYHRFFGGAFMEAVSCPSRGNCSAVGRAGTDASHPEGFAVAEVHGAWRAATLIPGVAGLSLVSCAAPGYCSAAGYHTGRGAGPYMVSEVRGTWGRAAPLPGAPLLYRSLGSHPVQSLSCASPGNCAAAGVYEDRSLRWQPYVVNQVRGVWRAPARVRGLAALGGVQAGLAGGVISVSCASPGNCSAGGSYLTRRWSQQAFLVSEVNGTWLPAAALRGLRSAATGAHPASSPPGPAGITSVSCPSAGNCTAVGTAVGLGAGGFLVRQVHGTWGTATPLKVPAAPRRHRWAMRTVLVSCTSPGDCAAGGFYGDPYGSKAFVIIEKNGAWATAAEDPSTLPFTRYDQTQITALSCARHGGCVAVGIYGTGAIPGQQDTQSTRAFLLMTG